MDTKTLSFSILRQKNYTIHNLKDRQVQYQQYLNRVQKIVDKKHVIDKKPLSIMKLKRKVNIISRTYRDYQNQFKISKQNSILLDKIIKNKNRKNQLFVNSFYSNNNSLYNSSRSFIPNFEERRIRQLVTIQQENNKMFERIIRQKSQVKRLGQLKKRQDVMSSSIMKNLDLRHSKVSKSLNIKAKMTRKLPKLVKQPSLCYQAMKNS